MKPRRMSTRHLIYASTWLILSSVWFAAGSFAGGVACAIACMIVALLPPRLIPNEYEELTAENERLADSRRTTEGWLTQAKLDAGYSRNTSFDIVWADALAALRERQRNELAPEADRNTFVQPVPDHCDRITWRGRYYGLPPCNPLQNPTSGSGEG